MKSTLGEIYDQVVTIKQSTLDEMGTFLNADSEQMINAQNRRQKEEDEYAEISKELKDWVKVNPEAGSEEFYKKKRELLVEKGLLKPEDNYLVFTKDIEFGSPSTAASIVRGGASNGLTTWRNSSGKTLKEIEESET